MSTPNNGFGQAAVNNTNGFGKAVANATNGFGVIHGRTWGHPNTNLVGGAGDVFPADGLQWSQIFNNAYKLHSGTGLQYISADGDEVTLSSTLNYTNKDFSIEFILNGTTSFGYVLANNSQNNRRIQIRTDRLAVRFGGSATNRTLFITWNVGDLIKFEYIHATQVYNAYVNDVLQDTTTLSPTNVIANFNSIGNANGAFSTMGMIYAKIIGDGQTHTFDFTQTSGNTLYPREYATTSLTGTINGTTPITGSAYGEQLYEWGYNFYTTGGVLDMVNGTVLVTGATKDATTDVLGNAIQRPAITNTYNAPKVDNYASIEQVAGDTVDTTGAISAAFWINPKTGGVIFDNGSAFAEYDDSTNNLEFTRDGVTTLTYSVAVTDFIFIAIVSTSAGLTTIYKGDLNNAPTAVVTNQAAGTATGASSAMVANNDVAFANSYAGYNQLAGFWDRELLATEITQLYNITASNFN